MQGSKTEKAIFSQNYRQEIEEIIHTQIPEAEIYDPYSNHRNSLSYKDETGRETFLRHNKMCGTEIDVLVAFIPEASMGTAVEMWEAWKNNATVISISPMKRNWVVRYLSHVVYPDMDAFRKGVLQWNVRNGKLILPPVQQVESNS